MLKEKEEMENVEYRVLSGVPRRVKEQIEALVKMEIYKSESEFIRIAIWKLLMEHYDLGHLTE